MPRLLSPLALGALVLVAATQALAVTPAPDPWKAALSFDYNVASERFAALHAETPADARIAIAYASSLLVKQPRTESNIRTARDLLIKARENAPANDESAVLATYLLARVELDHLDPAQPDSARARLEQLRKDHLAHPLADHAAVELAYLLTYDSTGANAAAVPQVEALLASVKDPGASRDLHSLLAGLYLRQLKNPAAALTHFVAARAVGYEQPMRNAEVDLTIGNLARETGDTALARKHYAAFIAKAPRDVRATTVRRLLAGLDTSPNVTAR
ncbi:MAG: hypothetical protein ABW223_06800 [Rariglobus sp.]